MLLDARRSFEERSIWFKVEQRAGKGIIFSFIEGTFIVIIIIIETVDFT